MSFADNNDTPMNAFASSQAPFTIPEDPHSDSDAFDMSDDEEVDALCAELLGGPPAPKSSCSTSSAESGKMLNNENSTETVGFVNVPYRVVSAFPKGIHRIFRDANAYDKQVGIKIPSMAANWVMVEIHLMDKISEHEDYVPHAPRPFAEVHQNKHLRFCIANNIVISEANKNINRIYVEMASLPNHVLHFHKKTFELGRKKKSMVSTKEPKFTITVTPVDDQGVAIASTTQYKTAPFQVRSKEQPNKDLAAAGKPTRSKKRRRTALSEKKRQMLDSLENDIKNCQKDINEEMKLRDDKEERMQHMLALLDTVSSAESEKMKQMITSLLQAHKSRQRNMVGV